jgi:leucyl aminopeptidase
MILNPPNYRVDLSPAPIEKSGAVAVLIHKQQGLKDLEIASLPAWVIPHVMRAIEMGIFKGKSNELSVQSLEIDGKSRHPRRLMLLGLGNIKKFSAECLREAGVALARAAGKLELAGVEIIVPPVPDTLPGHPDAPAAGQGVELAVQSLALGLGLGSFAFEEFKGAVHKKNSAKKKKSTPIRYTLVGRSAAKHHDALNEGLILAEAQNFARTLSSRPGNAVNPPELAKIAQSLAREAHLTCRVLDESQLRKLGMGGLLAVGAGSQSPPRLIVLEHRPKSASTARSPLLVVGKAITFDTGGISIKPAERMGKMIYDKCGGMAVLGLMWAVARLKVPIPVVGILASAENHISGRAYRPGDIITLYNGVTVEVTNTDAEGRLVLGDALAWGVKTYKPAAVVDLATLTGGVIVALGRSIAGAMANDDELFNQIHRAAQDSGERIWRLPLGDEQREQMKSDHADIVNSAGRDGHPLQGGAFLSYFLPDEPKTPWVHLDIAGVADQDKVTSMYAKGATGWGVRTLVRWVLDQRTKTGKR